MVAAKGNPPQPQNTGFTLDKVPPDFYKNQLEIRHAAISNTDDFMTDVREVRVEESLYEPCRFTLILDNPYGPGEEGGKPGKYTDSFKPGENWEIRFKTSKSEYPSFLPDFEGRVFAGQSFKVAVSFDKEAQGRVIVTGYDELALLAEGVRNRTFTNRSHKDIVETIARDVGITIKNGSIEDTGIFEEYICQAGETNLQFLSKIAAMNGFELFVQCEEDFTGPNGILYFRKPKSNKSVELRWGENIRSIKPRYKKFQINEVDIPYWKYKEKRIDGQKTQRSGGAKITSAGGVQPKNTTVSGATFIGSGSWNINSLEKAQRLNQSLCDQYEGQFLCAEIELEGNADLRPGSCVEILSDDPKADLKSFTGKYYVTDTCHLYQQGKFITKITVSETGGYNLFLHNLSPVEHLRPGQTPLVGIVTNNKDDDKPPNMGCVKVRFPALRSSGDPKGIESCWARVATAGAGKNRGIDWLPEIGDEVVVAFENGDIHRPYIIGNVWNGVDSSPEGHKDRVNGNGVRLRTLKTRVGHEIEFVEEDGSDGKQKGIYIHTADQFKVELNDTKKEILLTTPNGMSIKLNDKTNTINIKAGGGGRIRLDSTGVHIN